MRNLFFCCVGLFDSSNNNHKNIIVWWKVKNKNPFPISTFLAWPDLVCVCVYMLCFFYVSLFVPIVCRGFAWKLLEHTASAIITQYQRHTYGYYYSFYSVQFIQLNSHMLCTVRICWWWKSFLSQFALCFGILNTILLI